MRRFLLTVLTLGLILLFGVKLTFTCFVPKAERTLDKTLAELLPASVEGWKSHEVPLSSSPDGAERVLDILSLDDYFSREYVRGDTRVMVYVAYWYPASEPYSSVAVHNPDSCWVIAGWNVEERVSDRRCTLAGYPLKSHEWGIYSRDGQDAHVIFWHLLGGEPNEHIEQMVWTQSGLDSFKRQYYFIYNIFQMGLDLGRDQLFVRISSNRPFEELESEVYFKRLLDALRPLGIEEPEAATSLVQ